MVLFQEIRLIRIHQRGLHCLLLEFILVSGRLSRAPGSRAIINLLHDLYLCSNFSREIMVYNEFHFVYDNLTSHFKACTFIRFGH